MAWEGEQLRIRPAASLIMQIIGKQDCMCMHAMLHGRPLGIHGILSVLGEVSSWTLTPHPESILPGTNCTCRTRTYFASSCIHMPVQGRAQEALTLLTAAIVASPTYAEAHNNLGVLQRDVGAIPEVGVMSA